MWKVFVISLEDDVARRRPLVEALAAAGIVYEIQPAVDGRRGLAPEAEARVRRESVQARLGYDLSDPELACALSHQDVYRRIVAEGLEGAVVLEDDARLMPGFPDFLRERAYARAAILLLDHSRTRVWRWGSLPLLPGVRAHRLAADPDRATGYSITAAAARTILERSTPLAGLPDWPCTISDLGSYAVLPRLVDHPADEEGISHLAAHRDPERWRRPRQRKTVLRFLTQGYWRRWWWKRLSRRVA